MTDVISPFQLSKFRPISISNAPKNAPLNENKNDQAWSNYFSQLERIVQQIYRRTGSETDDISTYVEFSESNEITLSGIMSDIKWIRKKLAELEEDHKIDYFSKISSLEARINQLEQDQMPVSLAGIYKRLQEIEEQI